MPLPKPVTRSKDEPAQPAQMMLDPGVYVNLFEVILHEKETEVMVTARKNYPYMRALRAELEGKDALVYAWEDTIFGYGSQADTLSDFGFTAKTIFLKDHPHLTQRMILEGYILSLKKAGYTCSWQKGGVKAFQLAQPLFETQEKVRLYRGFELHGQFLWDTECDQLAFGIVVDAVFAYRDRENHSLRVEQVLARFGSETLKQLRHKQGDLSPAGNINLEVSRERLLRQTLPFVEARHRFVLPCGVEAELSQNPARVVLVGEEMSE